MNRKERRSAQKQGIPVAKPKVMTIKIEDFEAKMKEIYEKGFHEGLKQKTDEAVDEVMVMILGLPCKVLAEEYGWGKKRLETFGGHMIEHYSSWSDSELDLEGLQNWIFENVGLKFQQVEEE